MAARIKVLFQLNQVGFGGTEKAMFTFCQNLDRERFEPYLFFHTDYKKPRYYLRQLVASLLPKHRKSFVEKYQTYFARLPDFQQVLDADHVFLGTMPDFLRVLETINPHIIHFNRGDEQDFYTQQIDAIDRKFILVEHSIFGKKAAENYLQRLDRVLLISQWLKDKYAWTSPNAQVLYYPTQKPKHQQNLRSDLQIPEKAFVIGRISRPNLDNGLFVREVFQQLQADDTYLLWLAPPPEARAVADQFKNMILLDPTTDENRLSAFYNSLDVLLHYRIEGETFGLNIAEAMIHGKPVISHHSFMDNAQVELLQPEPYGEVGQIAPENDQAAFVKHLLYYKNNPEARQQVGANARQKALALFAEDAITRQLEQHYFQLTASKI